MSSSLPIPTPSKRKQPVRDVLAASYSSSSAASSYSSNSSPNLSAPVSPATSSLSKGKSPAHQQREVISPRRPSLLGEKLDTIIAYGKAGSESWLTMGAGSSLSKSDYTVINLGHDDGPPRLVRLHTKHAQQDYSRLTHVIGLLRKVWSRLRLEPRYDRPMLPQVSR
jgi:hypothetical protein